MFKWLYEFVNADLYARLKETERACLTYVDGLQETRQEVTDLEIELEDAEKLAKARETELSERITELQRDLDYSRNAHREADLSLRQMAEENTILKHSIENLMEVVNRDRERIKAETAIAVASQARAVEDKK